MRAIDLGRRGEEIAEQYLLDLGMRVLRRHYRIRGGEIDLVAEENGTLVFVEVKTRSTDRCGRPAEAVGHRKQARLTRAARFYLMESGNDDRPCRFDVVEVIGSPAGRFRVVLTRNAFEAG